MQNDKSGNHAYRAPDKLGTLDFKRKDTKKKILKFSHILRKR